MSDEARQIGAVNTVVIDKDGRTTGHNTDRSGFRAAFIEAFGKDAARDKAVLQLGAGGAGRAVAFALARPRRGVARHLRPRRRAGEEALRRSRRRARKPLDAPEPAAANAAGIVNATPIGMQGHPGLPMTPDVVRAGQFVADVIYTPLETEFVKAAKAQWRAHHGRRGHVRAPGGRCLPAVHRQDAGHRAHEADLRRRGGTSNRRRTRMKTSIATVSLSGTLGEKLEAIAAAKFDAVEIFENDLVTFNGTPADVRQRLRASSGSTSSPCSRSATSRACRPASASAPSRAPSASSTSCRSSAPTS